MPGSLARYLLPAFAMSALLVEPLLSACSPRERTLRSTVLFGLLVGAAWSAAMLVTASLIGINVRPPLIVGAIAVTAVGLQHRTHTNYLAFNRGSRGHRPSIYVRYLFYDSSACGYSSEGSSEGLAKEGLRVGVFMVAGKMLHLLHSPYQAKVRTPGGCERTDVIGGGPGRGAPCSGHGE